MPQMDDATADAVTAPQFPTGDDSGRRPDRDATDAEALHATTSGEVR